MLVVVCGVAGWFGAAPAFSAVTHEYLPGVSGALTGGVPAEGPLKEVVAQPGPLLSVRAMTVDQGHHLWLAEDVEGGSGVFRIDEFNSGSGAFEAQLPQAPTLHGIDAIAAGHKTGERELYVATSEGSTSVVALFGASGALQTTWTGAGTPSGSFQPGATGVAVDGNASSVGDWAAGDLYVSTSVGTGSETGGGVVDVLEPNVKNKETYVTQIIGTCPEEGKTCTPAEEAEHPFSAPSQVAVSALTGEVFVLDAFHVVDVFRPVEVASVKTFEYVRQFVAPAGVNLTSLGSIAVDGADGDVYLASELGVVHEFTTEGKYLGRITETPAGPLGLLLSVAVDQESHDVFVGEPGVVDAFGANLTIPGVAVTSPTGVGPMGVTLNGLVDPEDAGEATCRFEYGTSLSYGSESACTAPVANGSSEEPVQSEPIGGLQPGTVYHYRLDATNANGTNTGEDAEDLGEFLTLGPGIREASASDVSATAATLNASIYPNGVATSYHFEYDTREYKEKEGPHGTSLPAGQLPAGTTDVEVPAEHIQGLAPDTVYHFRVVATSGGETFDGPDETFTTQTAGTFTLADGRQWELVSPADKHGALILPINERGVMQAAANGEAMTYVADAPTESGPSGYAEGVQVFSTRGPEGWQSRDIALPHEAVTRLSGGDGFEFRFFSEDLSQGVMQPYGALVASVSPESSEQTAMLSTNYLDGNVNEPCLPSAGMHCFRPLVTGKEGYANVPEPGTVFGEEGECSGAEPALVLCGPHFLDATPDASHIVLSSTVGLDPQITGEGLYEWTAGRLAPVSVLPKGAGVALLPGLGAAGDKSRGARGAISEDGSRVFWSSSSGGEHLYVRNVPSEETVQLDVPQGVKVLSAPNPEFQVASANGSMVLFTDPQNLTAVSGKVGSDLYESELHEEALGVVTASLTDIAPGADVQGQVLGISKDGSWVYFVANGVLAPGAVHGTCRQSASIVGEECNLYVRHAGVTQLVAVLSGADKPDWNYGGPALTHFTARVSPDGQWLAFMSQRELTGYDNRDVVSGQPDEEVFLYNGVTRQLVCASCNPTGARPVGEEYEKQEASGGLVGGDRVWEPGDWLAANVPGWTPFELDVARYQSRYLSDSGRLFFNARDGLVPQAVNESWDVYEFEPEGVPAGGDACSAGSASGSDVYRAARGFVVEGRVGEEGAGCVALMSSGESSQESAFLDASESGGDVFFLTTAKLEPRLDYDNDIDVYDAHECTGASPCAQPPAEQSPVCETEASCKASPTPQPTLFGAPASATFGGPGNPPPPVAVKPAPKPLTRAQKLAAALKSCRKDHARSKSKRVACERAARKKYGAKAKAKGSSHHDRPIAGKGGH